MKMNEIDFLEKINDIDPALLADRPAEPKRRGLKTLRRIALAAAAVLLLGGVVYAVANRIELRKTSESEREEEGFEAKAELPLVPWSSFTGEIQTAREQIVQQYVDYVPEPVFSNYRSDPGSYTRRFATIGEAVAYIGLEGLKTPTFPFDEYDCTVSVHGDETGLVDQITLYAEHIEWNDIGAQETVTILTDAASNTAVFSGGVWTYEFPRDVEFQHYDTPGGSDCAIAVLRPEYDNDYMGLTGYMAVGCAFYELNLGAVPQEKYEIALQMLHDWADALDK